jgi:hypothetical protein
MSNTTHKVKPRVIVEVCGGLVTRITGDQPVDVLVVDWDNIQAGDQSINWWPVQVRMARVNAYAKTTHDFSLLNKLKNKEDL